MSTDVHSKARQAVIRQLAGAYDRHAEHEQELVGKGLYHLAEDVHVIALRVLRAYQAETDDPKPVEW